MQVQKLVKSCTETTNTGVFYIQLAVTSGRGNSEMIWPFCVDRGWSERGGGGQHKLVCQLVHVLRFGSASSSTRNLSPIRCIVTGSGQRSIWLLTRVLSHLHNNNINGLRVWTVRCISWRNIHESTMIQVRCWIWAIIFSRGRFCHKDQVKALWQISISSCYVEDVFQIKT